MDISLFEDEMSVEIKEILKDLLEAVRKISEPMISLAKTIGEYLKRETLKKIKYPQYKTKYRTVSFYKTRIYYNCRNTC